LFVWAGAGKHSERGDAQAAAIAGLTLILLGGVILAIAVSAAMRPRWP
jgi:hypothetical protein